MTGPFDLLPVPVPVDRGAGPIEHPFRFDVHWPRLVHELKTVEPYFSDVRMGHKSFEVRYNDRKYQVGDLLVLRCWVDGYGYTGQHDFRVVDYVLEGGRFGIEEGYVVLSLANAPLDLRLSVRAT